MADSKRVLMADFDRDRLAAAEQALRQAGYEAESLDNGADLLQSCRALVPEAVVVEAMLPRKNGFEVLKSLKEDSATAAIRVVLLIDEGDTYGEHRARLCGADMILQRPFTPEALVDAVRTVGHERALQEATRGEDDPGISQDLPGLSSVLEALEGRARAENPLIEHITDELTGLYNRAYTELKLADEVKKVRRFYHPLTCVLVGIDEQPGIDAGEAAQELRRAINETAGILLCESRDIDHLARYAGREFVCLLPHTDTPGGVAMADRILQAVAGRDFQLPGVPQRLTASAGLASFAGTGMEAAEDLLGRAREALETSRQWGGNRCTVWTANPSETPEEAPSAPRET